MRARHRERREHPDLLVVDKEMRTGTPFLRIAVERLELPNVTQRESICPLGQRRNLRVVQNDERRTPCLPLQRVTILIEGVRVERLRHDAFPSSHRSLRVLRLGVIELSRTERRVDRQTYIEAEVVDALSSRRR